MLKRMKVSDLLDLRAIDYRGKQIRQILWRIDTRALPKSKNPYRYQKIQAEMVAEGINRVPIYVSDGTHVGDGLHRIKLAYLAGLEELVVSDDLEECRSFGPVL